MKVKILSCEPHRSHHSFTVATRGGENVRVCEWDFVGPSTAQQVAQLELPVEEYKRIVAEFDSDEKASQEHIVATARRQMEHHALNRLAHRFL